MQRRLTTQDVTWFLDTNGMGRLDLEPSYQRKSVWTRRDRQYFLDTIFNNYPSPAIFLHKDIDDQGNTTYHVVDGKQRLETILLFVDNKLPIRDDIGDTRLANKRWRDIVGDLELKRKLWDYQFTVEMLDSIEPAVVNEVFGRLNQNSRKLTPQEIRHSRYDGWFVTFAEVEADRPLWKSVKVSTTARARRMQDVQFISELMALTISRQIVGFDQDAINELYARFEEPEFAEPEFSVEQFAADFEAISVFLQEAEDACGLITQHAGNFAHLFSLWAWLVKLEVLPKLDDFSASYSVFMDAVGAALAGEVFLEGAAEVKTQAVAYADSARGATTDIRPRTARDVALTDALQILMSQ